MTSASACPPGMRWVPGGCFTMGSNRYYPEESPTRRTRVGGFWLDATPVTNRQFQSFVDATGYLTQAERPPRHTHPNAISEAFAVAGSMVFDNTHPAATSSGLPWWHFRSGACWHNPLGTHVLEDNWLDHPAVHISVADAEAYAQWAGKALPTEAEWEFAAKGGLDNADYAWGDDLHPEGRILANTWQGEFPWVNQKLDGWERTSPVRTYPPNPFGLYDLIGNIWEWTSTPWALPAAHDTNASCCARRQSNDPAHSKIDRSTEHRVIKGGSHLCAPNYCQRYRPAARHPQAIDTTTSHIGFRCAIRPLSPHSLDNHD